MEYGFLVFGLINLIIAIIVYPLLRKKVENLWCGDEVRDVRTNKICFRIYFTLSLISTLIGIILII